MGEKDANGAQAETLANGADNSNDAGQSQQQQRQVTVVDDEEPIDLDAGGNAGDDAIGDKDDGDDANASGEGDDAGDDAGDADDKSDKGEGDDKDGKKKLSGSRREKLRSQALLNENAELQRRLEAAERGRKPDGSATDDGEKPPKEEDFGGDWFAYQRALTAHEAGKAVRDALKKQSEETRTSTDAAKRQDAIRERDVAHMDRVEDAREVITDFDKVMEGMKGVNVRNEVLDEIKSSDKSALLAYHFAKNPEKLTALDAMSSREVAREIGRLEATLKMPTANKQTKAPTPPRRVAGGSAPRTQEADLNGWLKKTYGDQ